LAFFSLRNLCLPISHFWKSPILLRLPPFGVVDREGGKKLPGLKLERVLLGGLGHKRGEVKLEGLCTVSVRAGARLKKFSSMRKEEGGAGFSPPASRRPGTPESRISHHQEESEAKKKIIEK